MGGFFFLLREDEVAKDVQKCTVFVGFFLIVSFSCIRIFEELDKNILSS